MRYDNRLHAARAMLPLHRQLNTERCASLDIIEIRNRLPRQICALKRISDPRGVPRSRILRSTLNKFSLHDSCAEVLEFYGLTAASRVVSPHVAFERQMLEDLDIYLEFFRKFNFLSE